MGLVGDCLQVATPTQNSLRLSQTQARFAYLKSQGINKSVPTFGALVKRMSHRILFLATSATATAEDSVLFRCDVPGLLLLFPQALCLAP